MCRERMLFAVNLALALSRLKRRSVNSSNDGASTFEGTNVRVGLMDADIYGPSVPTLMSLVGLKAETNEHDLLVPLSNFGLKCMSMGFLMDESSAAVREWRD
jgi:Mrp family chromosome partitioning ATPase